MTSSVSDYFIFLASGSSISSGVYALFPSGSAFLVYSYSGSALLPSCYSGSLFFSTYSTSSGIGSLKSFASDYLISLGSDSSISSGLYVLISSAFFVYSDKGS